MILTAEQVYAVARAGGATHDEAVMLTAVAKPESGWNTGAYNPNAGTGDNSYGLWQINMLGDMGPSRREWFGISSNDELYDPVTNARAAVLILRSQGWGAWTAWRNGLHESSLPAAQAAGAAIGDDYAKVAADLSDVPPTSAPVGGAGRSAPAGGGGGFVDPQGLPENASPEEIEAYIRENYPQYAGFLDIPELRMILTAAAREEWTGAKLQSQIQTTEWWKTTGPSVRQWMAVENLDPAKVKEQVERRTADVLPLAKQFGLGDTAASEVAEMSLRFGWSDQQIRGNLAYRAQAKSDQTGFRESSQPDVEADRLMALARQEYLIPLNRQDVERWVTQINAGLATEEEYLGWVADQSKQRFPDLIERGLTPGQHLAPIRNIVAETLELNPDDIDFLDRRWAPLVEHEGDNGYRPMTYSEAMRWARKRKEFRYTKTAMAEADQLVDSLFDTFGVF